MIWCSSLTARLIYRISLKKSRHEIRRKWAIFECEGDRNTAIRGKKVVENINVIEEKLEQKSNTSYILDQK